jgi:large subunit ribosomal protein L23Ae
VTSDKASRKTDLRATKPEIRRAITELYHVNPVKISTLITSKCLKKAYVRRPADFEAMNIANEMGA